jgi:hypothetical protein
MEQDFDSNQEVLGPAALRMADRAARLDKPDWQILLKLKTDGIGLLLPDVQKMRAIAAGLQMRFREEVSQRRFDDAIRTAKTMFAMSRHMGEHPTLIGDLVGIAIATIAIGPLEEMLEQPGCPNLYWALTNLPCPLVSVEKGMEGERTLIQAEFNGLVDTTPMTPEQIKKVITYLDKIRLDLPIKDKKETMRAWLDARNKNEALLKAVRGRLVEHGIPRERIEILPADQVLLLDQKRLYEVRRDEVMKLMNLPTWQVEAMAIQVIEAKQATDELGLFDFLVPALTKVRRAQGRIEQRIGLLRHVEALRLYAAAHEGKLPAKLEDIDQPLPFDPFTGKPFRYQVEGATAHIRGTPPAGDKQNPALNVHYAITIQK